MKGTPKTTETPEVMERLRKGNTVFIGSACAAPLFLVRALGKYLRKHRDIFSAPGSLRLVTLGVETPPEPFFNHFRRNSFFIDAFSREAVNRGQVDYAPVFLSRVPSLFRDGFLQADMALLQCSPPDRHGYMSLGISVDMAKAVIETARLTAVQVNRRMPRVHGDTFIHIDQANYVIPYDEPLREYRRGPDREIASRIGRYVASLIEDGDTLQVGYGSIPDAILANLHAKRELGIHTELIGDGIVDLMKKGVVDNSRKTVDRGKTVATFCMGSASTYAYLHENPSFAFRTLDYTNNPLIIASQRNMVAINSALEVDLSGQSTAQSLGKFNYSGFGGQTDFMRGAALSKGGKSILTVPSTSADGKKSRIVPYLSEGAGTTLTRGDVHYVVTEYGIAYIHGKSVRERALELVSVAHPRFRPLLIETARTSGLIYSDQAFIPGEKGTYPEHLETYRTTGKGIHVFLRPIRITDEPLLREFFFSLSERSSFRKFISDRVEISHRQLQELVVIDYTEEMAILAIRGTREKEEILGLGRYYIDPSTRLAEVAFAVRDDSQNLGIGSLLLSYLTYLARRQGLIGFTADVVRDNEPMLHVFETGGFRMEKQTTAGLVELKMYFKKRE
jgi:acyl-CoA hydrolase